MSAKIIEVNEENLDKYGLFCRKSYMREEGNKQKVDWLKNQIKAGLRYHQLLVHERGKLNSRGFIEYIPGEFTWRGISAKGWMSIICLWVTGKAKEQGHGSGLLNKAIEDAHEKNMYGVVAMAADKQGWLPSPDIYEKNGFERVDEYEPYFSLYVKRFDKDAPNPKFNQNFNENLKEYGEGITILYTHQCPHIKNMIDEIKEFADKNNLLLSLKLLESAEDVQKYAVHPYGVFSVILNEKLITYKPGMRKETLGRLKENL
ncbi:MAG: hypothetical protein GF317_18755 [Candidatus Lokiarchaeota archaeon]|nr:hypothetical protein [Candidatus Lokiarchaeota archaeon]MBD3201558.1 hypothetical protein [Candidatus Lokiarchaeota archaeon]